MTAEEYFYTHWQEANRSKFGDYGDYDSDEYAIAFANDYAALRIHDVVGRSEQLPCDYCEETKPLKYCQDCWEKLEQFKQCY
jgi:hypothetical protein